MQHQIHDEQPLDVNEMSLREHLLAAQAAGQAQSIPHHDHNSMSPTGLHIDPAFSGSPYGLDNLDDEEIGPDGKRGKHRELSGSKRAAQNRAAQRAFRQRKEGYIKKLEEQVRDFTALEESYKMLQGIDYELRSYILTLQSRLLEAEGAYPPPPPSIAMIDMQPRPSVHASHHLQQQQLDSTIQQLQQMDASNASMGLASDMHREINPYGSVDGDMDVLGPAAVSQLQAAAAAAQAGEYVPEHEVDDIKRALRPEEEEAYAIEAAKAAYAASKDMNESG